MINKKTIYDYYREEDEIDRWLGYIEGDEIN